MNTTTTCPHCGAGLIRGHQYTCECGTEFDVRWRPYQSPLCRERQAHAATRKALESARKWALSREDDINKAREELDDVRKQLAEMTAIAEEFEKACNHHRQRCHWEARKHYDRAISLKHNHSRLEAARKEAKP